MGKSTDGQICFGILFDEDVEFPWDEEYGGCIEDWWLYGVLGFRHSFELYSPQGEYVDDVEPSKEKIDEYFGEKRKFEEEHEKLPVVLVNYCSYEFPMHILAVPDTVKTANRGYPREFDPQGLVVTEEQKLKLLEFCEKYGVLEGEPAWYLSSFCG